MPDHDLSRLGSSGRPTAATALRVVITVVAILYTVPVFVGFTWRGLDTILAAVVTAGLSLPWLISAGRRGRPVLCFVLIAGFLAVQVMTDLGLAPANLLLLGAVYNLASRRPRSTSLAAVGVAGLLVLAATMRWADWSLGWLALGPVAAGWLAIATAWVWGVNSALRRAYQESLIERAEQLRREQEQRALLAAAQERTRIARDLHDVISHGLAGSLTLTEATLRSGANLTDSQRNSLQLVATSCRSALEEFRKLLRLMRDEPDLTPDGVPDSASISVPTEASGSGQDPDSTAGFSQLLLGLEQTLRSRNIETTVQVSGDPADLPPPVADAVRRLLQESTTNVLKHAKGVSHVRFSLSIGPAQTSVAVVDDGHEQPTETDGFGLLGMRERVEALHGTLHVGPRPGGGFAVQATLPLPENLTTATESITTRGEDE